MPNEIDWYVDGKWTDHANGFSRARFGPFFCQVDALHSRPECGYVIRWAASTGDTPTWGYTPGGLVEGKRFVEKYLAQIVVGPTVDALKRVKKTETK